MSGLSGCSHTAGRRHVQPWLRSKLNLKAIGFTAVGKPLLDKQARGRGVASGTVVLEAHRLYPLTVRYAHATGRASLHMAWSGPSFTTRVLEPATHPAGL